MKTILYLFLSCWATTTFSQISGDEFIGTWKNPNKYFPIKIEWKEARFLIHEKEHTMVGRLEDGCLSSNTGMGTAEICYMPSGDYILVNGAKYGRTTSKVSGVVSVPQSDVGSSSSQDIAPFLGSWKNPTKAFPIRIKKEGSRIVLEEKGAKVICRVEKGVLVINTGMGKSEIQYLEGQDVLLVNGAKYFRTNSQSAQALKPSNSEKKNLEERLPHNENTEKLLVSEAFLSAYHAPFQGALHAVFPGPQVLCETCNVAEHNLFVQSLYHGYSKSERFEKATPADFPPTGMKCQVLLDDVEYQLKEGKLIPSGQPYKGYLASATIYFEFSDQEHPEPKRVSSKVKGGDPGKNHSKKEATHLLAKKIEQQVRRLTFSLFQVECQFAGIEEQNKKGKIKKIRLSNQAPLFPAVKAKEYKFIAVVSDAGENDRIEQDEILGEFQVTGVKGEHLIAKPLKGEEQFRAVLEKGTPVVFMSRLSPN